MIPHDPRFNPLQLHRPKSHPSIDLVIPALVRPAVPSAKECQAKVTMFQEALCIFPDHIPTSISQHLPQSGSQLLWQRRTNVTMFQKLFANLIRWRAAGCGPSLPSSARWCWLLPPSFLIQWGPWSSYQSSVLSAPRWRCGAGLALHIMACCVLFLFPRGGLDLKVSGSCIAMIAVDGAIIVLHIVKADNAQMEVR